MTTAAIAAGPSPAGPIPAGPISAGTVPAGTGRAAGIPTALTPGGAQAVFRATLDALARPGTVKRLPSAADEPLAAHVPAVLLPLLALADLSTPACVAGHEEGAWDEIVRVATNAPRTTLGDARLVAALRPLTADELAGLRTGTAAAPEDGALACLAVSGIAIVAGVDGVDAADVAGVGDAADVAGGVDAAGVADVGDAADVAGVDGVDAAGVAGGVDAADVADVGDAADGSGDDGSGDDGGSDSEGGSGGKGGSGADGGSDRGIDTGDDGIDTGDGGRLWLRLSGPGVPGTRAIIVTGLPAGFAAARRRLVAGFPAGADLLLIAPDGAMTGLPRTTRLHEEAS